MKSVIDNKFVLGDASKERFMTSQRIEGLSALGVTMAGTTKVVDQYICSRNAPNHHRLLLSIDGAATVTSQEVSLDILPEQAVFLPSGQEFVYQTHQPWQFVWFMFNQSLPPDMIPSSLKIESYDHAEEVSHICVLLLLNDNLKLQKLLEERLKFLIERALTFSLEPQSGGNKLHRLFSNVEQQLHLSWSVEDLAAHMHCSKASLHRHCIEEYRCSPMHKITQLRMSRACDLLRQTDWSIKHIAHQVGFKDPLNFSHRFKQWHNLSPKHYRANK